MTKNYTCRNQQNKWILFELLRLDASVTPNYVIADVEDRQSFHNILTTA